MILSKRAALNGVQLDELFPEIVSRSVDPGVPHETVSAVSRGGGFGQRVTGLIDAAIDRPAQMLDEGTEQALVHTRDLIVPVQNHVCLLHKIILSHCRKSDRR